MFVACRDENRSWAIRDICSVEVLAAGKLMKQNNLFIYWVIEVITNAVSIVFHCNKWLPW